MQIRSAAGHSLPDLHVIARTPPFYYMPAAYRLAQTILFPGWQVVHWLTGGVMDRTFEYKLLFRC